MKFKREVITSLIALNIGDNLGCVNKDFPKVVLIEKGEWKIYDTHGSCERTYVFKHKNKFYAIIDKKLGFYYQSRDWPEEVECHEVKKIVMKTHEWVAA